MKIDEDFEKWWRKYIDGIRIDKSVKDYIKSCAYAAWASAIANEALKKLEDN
jgi:hypothetical protein